MSDPMVVFARARLAEDEANARDALTLWPETHLTIDPGSLVIVDFLRWRHTPARVLREVEAMRAIVDLHQPEWTDYIDADHEDRTSLDCSTCGAHGTPDNWPCPTMRALAGIWRDHAGYDRAWGP